MQLLILLTVLGSFLASSGLFENSVDPAFVWKSTYWQLVLLSLSPALAYVLLRSKLTTGLNHSEKKDSESQSSLPELATLLVWMLTSSFVCFFSDWPLRTQNLVPYSLSLRLSLFLIPILAPILLTWFLNSFLTHKNLFRSLSETVMRGKVYLGTILVPLLALLLLKDIGDSFSGHMILILQMFLLPLGVIGIALGMPYFVRWILPSQSILSTQLGKSLLDLAKESNTHVSDIRVWGTGNQAINAIVVGLIPFGRTVFLTDRLIQDFEIEEIKAVYLHEIGHANRNHLFQRLVAAATPFFFTYAICQFCFQSEFVTLSAAIFASLIGLGVIARMLEYEADEFAAIELWKSGLDPNRYVQMLNRIRIENPNSDKQSWLHPRVSDRIRRIQSRQPIWLVENAAAALKKNQKFGPPAESS